MELDLPGGPTAPKLARSAVEERLADRVPPRVLEDVRLVVSELVTNSVLQARAGPEDHVRLRIRVLDSAVRLEVTDPGPGPGARRPERTKDHTGGWGLMLVDKIAGRWGVDPGRPPTVWAEIAA